MVRSLPHMLALAKIGDCYGLAPSVVQDTKHYHWPSGASGWNYVIQHHVYGLSGLAWHAKEVPMLPMR
jgi:hypothetical protein